MLRPDMNAVARALGAGAAGVLALRLVRPLERALAGGEPVFAVRRIASRLASRAGLRLDRRRLRWASLLLQWGYGPGLALTRELAFGRPRGSRARRALTFGAGIYAFELVALPATGATPPLRRWTARELAALAAHVLTFAAAVEIAA